jgi:hypothetical protein
MATPATPPHRADAPPAAAHPPATRPKSAHQHSGNRSANAATVGLEQAAPAITSRPASTHPPTVAGGLESSSARSARPGR